MITKIEIDTWVHDGKRKAMAERISSVLQGQDQQGAQGYIISARTTGWGDYLLSLVAAWYHAKASGKTLIIDWRSSLYLSNPELNAFVHYFQSCSEIAGVPVICEDPLGAIRLDGAVYSPIWQRTSRNVRLRDYQARIFHEDIAEDCLSKDRNDSTITYYDCVPWAIEHKELSQHVLKNINLKPLIQSKVDRFIEQKFRQKMIGVHLRCGNQGDTMDHTKFWQNQAQAIERVCTIIDAAVEKFGSDCGLFLCTDTKEVEQTIRQKYPDAIVRAKDFRASGDGELHHFKFDKYSQNDRVLQMGEDALIDMYLLAASDVIVRFPPNSYFSFYASVFKRYRIEFSGELMPVIEY